MSPIVRNMLMAEYIVESTAPCLTYGLNSVEWGFGKAPLGAPCL